MKLKTGLKPEWERFCQLFASDYECFGNATVAYSKAYNKDIKNKADYATCRTNGARLLTNADILDRINELLKDLVMNDTTVDMQLAFLITQMGDYGAKIQAIKEYNKLKQRIVEKRDIRIDAVDEILGKYGLKDVGQTQDTENRPSKDTA